MTSYNTFPNPPPSALPEVPEGPRRDPSGCVPSERGPA